MSIVIPARDAAATLPEQFDALACQTTTVPFEVVLVDNASTDGTSAIVDAWRDQLAGLRVVTEPRLGVNHARNAGVRATTSELILFCDADDVVDVAWVDAMIRALESHDVVGGRLEYDRLNSAAARRHTAGRVGAEHLSRAYGRLWTSTANMGVRRTALDAVGGFDPDFELGTEDMDFCIRVADAGCSIAYAPDAVVHYRLRAELRPLLRQKFATGLGSSHLYAKHRRAGNLEGYPPSVRRNHAVYNTWRLVVTSPQLLSSRNRWGYLGRLAKAGGEVTGWWRYRRPFLVKRSPPTRSL